MAAVPADVSAIPPVTLLPDAARGRRWCDQLRRCLLYVCAPDDERGLEVLDDAIRAEQLVRPTVERCADRAHGPAARALARVPAGAALSAYNSCEATTRLRGNHAWGDRRGAVRVRRVTTLRMFVM